MSNQTQKLADGSTNNNFSMNKMYRSPSGDLKNLEQPKRDSRHTIAEEDQTTDWVPEIPFWNVSIAFH